MGRGGGSARVHLDDRGVPAEVRLRLRVDGVPRELSDPRVTLLDALRERLGLTGTKKGCNQGPAVGAPCWQMAGGCCPA